MIHPLADVQSKNIGTNTQVWQFSVILPGAVVGNNCNINCHTFIENDVIIGNNVTVKAGVFLWDGITVEDNAFIGPSVSFVNDKYPRSKQYQESVQRILLKNNCSIGANATILGGVTIGNHALIGAGSVVTKDVPDFAIIAGNPGKLVGFISDTKNVLQKVSENEYIEETSGKRFIFNNNKLQRI
jgi:UDP-2-acetamido-3-amino-2,3-dideoxy-glucuronate N-acetyltransferase